MQMSALKEPQKPASLGICGSKNFSVHTLSDSLRIYFLSTLESGFKNLRIRYRGIYADGSRIRKEKVVDSEISGYVWTGIELFWAHKKNENYF